MKRKFILFLLSVLILMCFCGCSSNSFKKISSEINKITVQITNTSVQPSGTNYSIKLTNGSSYTIIQNSLYLSYPIKITNGRVQNECKVEAKLNKLNIKPGEIVNLHAFFPIENYDGNNKLDKEHLQYEINGFISKLSQENHFEKSGDVLQ
ncbi:MAG: hypothetical protein Q8920_10070 [Bacillota bacterium]|nr:hypothetical protein [Bacillota bacterium]